MRPSTDPPQLDALVVTNMWPTPERPAFGRFVYDQVRALRALDGVSVSVEAIAGGGPRAYARAAGALRRRYRSRVFDVVHAHFGLSAWPALAVPARVHAVTLHGTDLEVARSRAVTLAALPFLSVVGVGSEELRGRVPGWMAVRARHGAGSVPGPKPGPGTSTNVGVQVLPCGVDLGRFRPLDRRESRVALGLDPDRRYVLFPADPKRPEKRYDLAREVVEAIGRDLDGAGVELLALGAVDPEQMPLWVNAADTVLVPSDREGFGLAVLEALACDVPVLATPHGVAAEALADVDGAYCGPFSLERWAASLAQTLSDRGPGAGPGAGMGPGAGAGPGAGMGPGPRIRGRQAAERYSAEAMAARVAASWRAALAGA